MSDVTIITNNVPRDVIYWHELSETEQHEFDYSAAQESTFVRYQGNVYDLGEFMRAPDAMFGALKQWDGYQSDSYFSGILVRYPREGRDSIDTDHVIVARYCA